MLKFWTIFALVSDIFLIVAMLFVMASFLYFQTEFSDVFGFSWIGMIVTIAIEFICGYVIVVFIDCVRDEFTELKNL